VRICIIGKFPPIQGGVSMRTYWTAHELAKRGHDVHVVTNAKEVQPPFRMYMRAQDWRRCTDALTVHWTDPVDRSQSHIPLASPFVTKLATVAAGVHAIAPLDVIYSHYMEPYGIAGHLAAQMTSAPHVVRMAGSDAGRLWHHRQFERLYDHVLRSAALVVATGTVADRAVRRGVDPRRIVFGGGYAVPVNLFAPGGAVLNLKALRAELARCPDPAAQTWGEFRGDRPHFGIYGKLGERKGTFALLAALQRLKRAGAEVGLVALAHGNAAVEAQFRERAAALGLTDRILQIPFLPHWRVPDFLRGCLAVCCLEQDFPIGFHSPIIAREVLLSGACLVGSREIIRKVAQGERLVDGYNCVAIEDVNDIATLAQRLGAIVRDPGPAAAVGRRGYEFARELEEQIDFPAQIERILAAAAANCIVPTSNAVESDAVVVSDRFALTRIAAATMARRRPARRVTAKEVETIDLSRARKILTRLERFAAGRNNKLQSLKRGVEIEIAIAAAENQADKRNGADKATVFRPSNGRWAIDDGDIADLVPTCRPRLAILEFDFDVAKFRNIRHTSDLPAVAKPRLSYVVVFAKAGGTRREPLVVDGYTAHVLKLCDGVRTVGEIINLLQGRQDVARHSNDLRWIAQLFARGLIYFSVKSPLRIAQRATPRRDHKAVYE
jgi:glycosyltransferase involved in cell wall biosynthesis